MLKYKNNGVDRTQNGKMPKKIQSKIILSYLFHNIEKDITVHTYIEKG